MTALGRILMLVTGILLSSACYVPSGTYRLTEVRFNGEPQPDDDCALMVVEENVLTCVPEKN